MGRTTTPTPFAEVRARKATIQRTWHGERKTVRDGDAARNDYADDRVCCTFCAHRTMRPGPVSVRCTEQS